MDRTTLATLLLCLGTAIAYADELSLILRTVTGSGTWPAHHFDERPFDPTALALADLAGSEPTRARQAAGYLRAHPSPEVSRALVGLLSDPDDEVAERAAEVLRDRGDPDVTEALYAFRARHPAV